MRGGKSDFFTMEPPLEPPAVQEGPSDPPKPTFGAKMVGPKKLAKMTLKGPLRAKNTKKKAAKQQSKKIPEIHPNRSCTPT